MDCLNFSSQLLLGVLSGQSDDASFCCYFVVGSEKIPNNQNTQELLQSQIFIERLKVTSQAQQYILWVGLLLGVRMLQSF